MGLHAHRFKFWPLHRRKLKLRLFGSYDLNGQHYILTGSGTNREDGEVHIRLKPYDRWAREVRIK